MAIKPIKLNKKENIFSKIKINETMVWGFLIGFSILDLFFSFSIKFIIILFASILGALINLKGYDFNE